MEFTDETWPVMWERLMDRWVSEVRAKILAEMEAEERKPIPISSKRKRSVKKAA
jgi:hypothetical protein